MKQHKIRAVFARGGTSKGLLFHRADLPAERSRWDRLFLAALGSPDRYVRQLNGMGGGLSSLSKVCVIGPTARADADVDYTFAQVLVDRALVDFTPLCGNMSSTIGPFAVDEGIVKATGERAVVRIHNTNTAKIIVATFPVEEDGCAAVDGDLAIPGVEGTGAPVRLDFLDPGGAITGMLLPTGKVCEPLAVPGVGTVEVSMIDASNPCVFVAARDLGLSGTEMPADIEADAELMRKLAAIRLAASLAMGVATSEEEAQRKTAVPFIGFVAPPAEARTLAGTRIDPAHADFVARVISNGQPHRALPLGVSMCLAVAARIEGSVVHAVTRRDAGARDSLRISMPSGILTVAAEVRREGDGWRAVRGGFFRTQRRLFDGRVCVSAAALTD
ncbi:MAG: PrpF family protein [Betaproteobacteria bacterium]|nr:MAG: PrpF family protein [Betaproteobacteria bacterium]